MSNDTALAILLDRNSRQRLSDQIATQVRAVALANDEATRLPSTRRLATELGVARGVVDAAWDQLRAEGWLESRQGAGTWLSPANRLPSPLREVGPAHAREVDPDEGLVLMDAGTPWRDERQSAGWRRAWREVSAARPPRGYDDPRGLAPLREALAERLRRTRGLRVGPDDVRMTAGTTAGLRHALTALPPGDVGLEDPGYRAAWWTVRAAGRTPVPVPAAAPHRPHRPDQSGPAGLAGLAGVYVTPAHQHPLGHVMPAGVRVDLLRAAAAAKAFVIEDDYDSEFRYDVAPIPALASLDAERVVYLGTASKAVMPTLRLGWLVAPHALRDDMDSHRRITHDVPAWAVQAAYLHLLRDGTLDATVRAARRVYAERAPRVVAALSPHATLAGPVAGMYSTWLVEHERAVAAREAAERAGFRINLLRDYSFGAGLAGLVVGFGGPTDDELDRALTAIAASLGSS